MKKSLTPSLSALAALVIMASFTGCETTGDPRSGGIFWSESKAQDRLYERRTRLQEVESDTRRVESQNRRLQSERSDLRQQL